MPSDPRRQLLDIYQAALAAVDGARCVAEHLTARRPDWPSLTLIAIGKAAAAMSAGAVQALGPRISRGLIITKSGHCPGPSHLPAGCECLEAGHPVPDQRSLAAGQRLLAWLEERPAGEPVLFLLSGGASALAEVLPEGVTPADLVRTNRWLLGSGLPIDRMNAVRQRLSALKAGRLAVRLGGRPAQVLAISDVPGDDPRLIGSGPLAPPAEVSLPPGLPAWLSAVLQPLPATVPAVPHALVATNAQARRAAAAAGQARGLAVHEHAEFLAGDAAALGERLADILLSGPTGLHVWGGEPTVTLPPAPGRGGRAQTLALAAARRLAGRSGVWLLAAGTDGTDGPTADAGALVDGGTLARGALDGLDAARALAEANAGAFLAASEDLVHTGPTGTNVMDLVLGLRLSTNDV